MKKRLKRIVVGLVAVVLSIVLLLTAAIPVCEAGPKERVVRLGWTAALTGPLAETGTPSTYGMVDCVRLVNERGGINGVKLELAWEDVGASMARVVTAYRRNRAKGVLVDLHLVIHWVEAMMPRIVKDEVPIVNLTALNARVLTKPQWVFCAEPHTGDVAGQLVKWFMNKYWTENYPPKVGVFIYESSSGRECLAGVEWACKQLGAEFVGYEVVPFTGCLDTSTEWLRLANRGSNLIVTGLCLIPQVVGMKDAYRLEIQKKGIKLMDIGYCMTDSLRVVRKQADGWIYAVYAHELVDTEVSTIKEVLETAKRYRGYDPEDIGGTYRAAWAAIPIVCEAIRLAMEEVGFENLTGRAVRDGLARIRDLDVGGLVSPITMSDTKPFYASGSYFYEIREGKPCCISDCIPYLGYYKTVLEL